MEEDEPRAPAPPKPASGSLPIRARTELFRVGEDETGMRLDQVLPRHVADLSRRQARTLLDLGGVFVNGVRTKVASRLVATGDEIKAFIGGALARAQNRVGEAARAHDAERLPSFTVLFEDADLVVVNKPAGLLTAPTPESDRNNLADLLARRHARRQTLFVVHRIDLQTSGVLVFAKTPQANRRLSERFAAHDIDRAYLAVVAGAFPDDLRTIDRPLRGKRAVTHVAVSERFGTFATALAVTLETGRTHQIRLHVGGLGHPVLGDPDVARASVRGPRPPRMALHAARLGFLHPITGAPLNFEAELPADLARWMERLRVSSP